MQGSRGACFHIISPVRLFVATFAKGKKKSKNKAAFLCVKPSGNNCKDSDGNLQLLTIEESLVFQSQYTSVGWYIWQLTVSGTMTAICVIHSCHHPKYVLPPTTNPMTTRVAAGSPTPLSITCSSTNYLDEAASSQGKDGAHVCVGGDDKNDLLSTGEGKMSKPIYSENTFYTNKAKENQYRFSHRELFYTSLQT